MTIYRYRDILYISVRETHKTLATENTMSVRQPHARAVTNSVSKNVGGKLITLNCEADHKKGYVDSIGKNKIYSLFKKILNGKLVLDKKFTCFNVESDGVIVPLF